MKKAPGAGTPRAERSKEDQVTSNIIPINGKSPFDQIRQVLKDGSEFWSARDLASAMTYDQWRNFATAIDRARVSLRNQGYEPEEHIADASKMVTLGSGASRSVEDFHLTRFGAYLTVMNGDPRKPEVAGAQAYFAVKTREAETARPVQELTEDEIVHQALQIQTRKVKELEAKVIEDAPKVDAYESFMDADGTESIGNVAKMLGLSQNKLFDRLRNAGILIAKGHMRNTPYQQYMHHFRVTPYSYERRDGTMGCSYTTTVQPSGVDFIRRKLYIPHVQMEVSS